MLQKELRYDCKQCNNTIILQYLIFHTGWDLLSNIFCCTEPSGEYAVIPCPPNNKKSGKKIMKHSVFKDLWRNESD